MAPFVNKKSMNLTINHKENQILNVMFKFITQAQRKS